MTSGPGSISAEDHYKRGAHSLIKGVYDRAITEFTQALALNPNLAEAYRDRGVAYAGKYDYDRAIADYDRALALNPNYAEAYLSRGAQLPWQAGS